MPHKRAKRSIRTAETAKRGQNLAPPTLSTNGEYAYNDTPRSGARILNSISVREAFHKAGRTTSEDTGQRRPKPGQKSTENTNPNAKGKGKDIPKILPNESLGEYNRRIEAFLRPGVSQAIKDANAIKAAEERRVRDEKKERKRVAKEQKQEKQGSKGAGEVVGEKTVDKGKKRERANDDDDDDEPAKPIKEFAPMPAPRRLNDIVSAPPVLPHLRRSKVQSKEDSEKSAFKATGRNPLSLAQKRMLEEERERVVNRYREMKGERLEKEKEEREKVAKTKTGGKKRRVEAEEA